MWQLIGYDTTLEFLDRSLKAGKLSHAYLFSGPPGVGKMTLALDLARALNCEGRDPPCQTCRPCRRITTGSFADVRVIGLLGEEKGGESRMHKEIGIDQVRSLQHDAQLRPYEGRYRVFIIDGAEHLSLPAANALLKILEEPPPHVILLLLCTDDKLLPVTVVSRCQHIKLRPLPTTEVERALGDRWDVEQGRARLLARLSRGRLGWAVQALSDERIWAERQRHIQVIIDLMGASIPERFSYASELAALFARDRHAVMDVLDLWASWWRDLLLVRNGCLELITNLDQAEILSRQAERISLQDIKVFLSSLMETLDFLNQNVNPRLALEALMLRLPRPSDLSSSNQGG